MRLKDGGCTVAAFIKDEKGLGRRLQGLIKKSSFRLVS